MPIASESPAVPSPDWPLSCWLAWQETLHHRPIDLGLDRVRAVAARLGVLEDVPLTIIVGGTNGKGSTARLLADAIRAAGYLAGLYTSPHLLRYNERIALDGGDAADEDICACFAQVERARAEVPLTYFEYGSLAALRMFKTRGVDAQVLEVGLGGRLDAVNIVDADCAIVTNVGLDHQDWLGRDRDAIGFEKAGIFRRNRPAIVGDPDPPEGLLVSAQSAGAQVLRLGRDFDLGDAASSWQFRFGDETPLAVPRSAMPGEGQRRNAACALAALRCLRPRLPVGSGAIATALNHVRMPGRFERVGHHVFDVAHNAEAAAELASNLQAHPAAGRTLLVLGMLSDKPVEAVCAALSGSVDRLFCVGLPPPRGLSGARLAERAAAAGMPGLAYDTVAAGLAAAGAEFRAGDRIVLSGSFLTVAAAKELVHG